ncbi:MAG: hypothetical protein GC161_11310 [Planctomycetaceae bacterium]|nr:hypothetical protein [Planctomycetaceae bacterium]
MTNESQPRSFIGTLANHGVVPKLAALTLLLGGIIVVLGLRLELFPPLNLQLISVQVEYPGASAEEVADSVLPAIEQACSGIRGLRTIRGFARDGTALVLLELEDGANGRELIQLVRTEIDGLDTLPDEALRPDITLERDDDAVLSIVVHGDVDAPTLRFATAELQRALTQAECPLRVVADLPRLEKAIEVSVETLRRYQWSIRDVAEMVRAANQQQGAGALGDSAESTLTSVQPPKRALSPAELRALDLSIGTTGTGVRLGSVAEVSEVFEDHQSEQTFQGQPALSLEVFPREGSTPVEVSDAVGKVLGSVSLPSGTRATVWTDQSSDLAARLGLVVDNGLLGMLFVVALLSIFVAPRVAIWVALGIPVSILGAFLLLGPWMDLSINQITLFAVLLVLGIVVDDAIVVGESISNELAGGGEPMGAAVRGARAVAIPVVCASLTNIAAFLPLGFTPGEFGTLFAPIAAVATAVLLVSLLEALLFLPAHLANSHRGRAHRTWMPTRYVSALLAGVGDRGLAPALGFAMRRPLALAGILLAFLLVSVAPVTSGRLGFDFTPRIEANEVTMYLVLEHGQSLESSRLVREAAEGAAQRAASRLGGDAWAEALAIYSSVGGGADLDEEVGNLPGPHRMTIVASLGQVEQREFTAQQFQDLWRDEFAAPEQVVSAHWSSIVFGEEPEAMVIELQHPDRTAAEDAADELSRYFQGLPGDVAVDRGAPRTTRVLAIDERPDALHVGLSRGEMVAQVRDALRGAEIERIATPDGEVNLLARLVKEERADFDGLMQLPIRTASDALVPLSQVADMRADFVRPQVIRRDGRNTVTVFAALEGSPNDEDEVEATLTEEHFPQLSKKFPGLVARIAGESEEEERALESLARGLLIALVAIYLLLAIPLKSYVQPFILLLTLPIGVGGALLAHALVGVEISIISLFGAVALLGVLVNNGLILLHSANSLRSSGMDPVSIAKTAAVRRLRPIVLTTVTTAVGLAPMIFERSPQAQFMAPMALSLAGGLLLATPWILVVIPTAFAVLEKLRIASARA